MSCSTGSCVSSTSYISARWVRTSAFSHLSNGVNGIWEESGGLGLIGNNTQKKWFLVAFFRKRNNKMSSFYYEPWLPHLLFAPINSPRRFAYHLCPIVNLPAFSFPIQVYDDFITDRDYRSFSGFSRQKWSLQNRFLQFFKRRTFWHFH